MTFRDICIFGSNSELALISFAQVNSVMKSADLCQLLLALKICKATHKVEYQFRRHLCTFLQKLVNILIRHKTVLTYLDNKLTKQVRMLMRFLPKLYIGVCSNR